VLKTIAYGGQRKLASNLAIWLALISWRRINGGFQFEGGGWRSAKLARRGD